MSSGYRALLQSLDETEKDVSRGLGRSVKIRKPKCCCCSNAIMWTCIAIVILTGLVISVGLPILLTVPVESSWHWKRWIPNFLNPQGGGSNSSYQPANDQQQNLLLVVGYCAMCALSITSEK